MPPRWNRKQQRGARRPSNQAPRRNNRGKQANCNTPAGPKFGGRQHQHGRAHRYSDSSVASFGTESSKSRHMVYKLKLQKIKTDGNSVKRHLESMLADVDEMERAFKTNMEWEPSFTNLIVKETPSLTGSPHTPSTGGVAIPAAHPAPTNNGPAVLAAPLSPRSLPLSPPPGIYHSARPSAPMSVGTGSLPTPTPLHQFFACPNGWHCRSAMQQQQEQQPSLPPLHSAASALATATRSSTASRSYTPMNVSRDAGVAGSADETPLPGSLQLEKGLFEAYNRGERAAGSSGGAWEM